MICSKKRLTQNAFISEDKYYKISNIKLLFDNNNSAVLKMLTIYKLAYEILKRQVQKNIPTTNLKLQKMAYFCYAVGLAEGKLFLSPKHRFVAWGLGHVNLHLHATLKHNEGRHVSSKELEPFVDLYEGVNTQCTQEEKQLIDEATQQIGEYSVRELVALSWVSDGPWDKTYKKYPTYPIQDGLVKEFFVE